MHPLTIFLFFCLFLLQLLFPVNALEQTIRSNWTSDTSFFTLYRMSSDDFRTEFLFMSDEHLRNPQAARFIFESPFLLLGNIKAEGLFRFFEMESLLSRNALKKRCGFAADSSAENLRTPGAVLILFDHLGCVFERHRDDPDKLGIWLNTVPFPYTALDLALGYYQGEAPNNADVGEWFPAAMPLPGGDLWQGGGDLRYEASFFSARIRAACSSGPHFLPGTTIMPDLTLFLNTVVIKLRYWRNSEYYRNSSARLADWNWQGEGMVQYYEGDAYWEASYRGGQPCGVRDLDKGISSEYSVRCRREGVRWYWDLQGCFESDPFAEESTILNPEASCSFRYHPWTIGLTAAAVWDGTPYEQSSRDIVLNFKQRLNRNITNSLKIAYSQDRKTAAIDPSWKTIYKGTSWSFEGKAAYFYSLNDVKVEPPYSLSVMVEWSR